MLAVFALVFSYAGRSVLRSKPFADRTTAALRDPAVQAAVADHLTDGVVRAHGDLIAVRPLIRVAVGGVVSSPGFAAVFHRAVLSSHAAVVVQRRPAAQLNVADAAVLIRSVLQRVAPGAAATVGAERAVPLIEIRPPAALLDAVRVARALYTAAWALALAGILLAAAALWASDDRALTARRIGTALALGGLALVGLYLIGGAVIQQTAPAGRGPAAGAVWRALAGGLRAQALWLAGAGAVVAGAASALMRPPIRAGGSLVPGAARRWLGAGLGREPAPSLLLVAIGLGILLEPGSALAIVAVAAGLLAVTLGVAGVLRWAGRAGAQARRRRGMRRLADAVPAVEDARAGSARSRLWPVAVSVVALAVALAVIGSGSGDEAPAAVAVACNGSSSLCARRLDDVVFPATHNSFASVTIPTFLFGQQDGTIADQLQFGIRGFLIDTYYGYPTKGRVRTDTTSLPKRALAVQELGEPAIQAAERIRGGLGSMPVGSRGIYLCHGFCELGAVPLASALSDLRSFLIANPGEVVIVINQDEGPTPADIAAAFEHAGLDDLIYRGPLGPFPTLRQMIDSGQRLVVMAENDAGDIPWYHLAYQHALQETPFRFRASSALTDTSMLSATCKPNRGPDSAPLFLLSNWIDTTPVPRPSNATIVNAYATLLRRAQTCRRIRRRLPNLIAVDFYRHGDVVGVARTINDTTG